MKPMKMYYYYVPQARNESCKAAQQIEQNRSLGYNKTNFISSNKTRTPNNNQIYNKWPKAKTTQETRKNIKA